MDNKIKVLECIRQGQIGGGESHLLSLVENLDATRFAPRVLSFTDGPMIERLKEMKVPAHVIYTETPFDVRKWGEVKRFLKEWKPDVIHAHGTRAASNVLWAARSLNIPVIYTVHGWSFHQDQGTLVRNIRMRGEKYIASRTALNISVSRSNQQSGKDAMPEFESVVINNGIDQKKFNPARSFKNIRQELGIPESSLLVLFIARFTAHKQPIALIEAFKKALPAYPDMHLLMVGEGDERGKAEALIAQYGIGNNVTLEGFRQDVPDVLAAADIFVLPSLWEGLPIGLLEAMAMGKAVIATNVDGTTEVVENNKNGLLIETTGLIENLSAALLRLATNGDERKTFARNAMSTVNERFAAGPMTRQIEAIYSATVQKKAGVQKAELLAG